MNAVDTNILIYAASSDDQDKGRLAVELLERLAGGSPDTVLLWQVVCEFTAYAAKARARVQASPDSFEYLSALKRRFRVVVPSTGVSERAIQIHVADQVSIWDAFLIASCADAGVTTLYTEDVQSRPVIQGVTIVNPFR